jgi:hypothetical protein
VILPKVRILPMDSGVKKLGAPIEKKTNKSKKLMRATASGK